MNFLLSVGRFLIERLLSGINGNQRSEFSQMFDQAKDKVRKILVLALAAAASASLFVAGIIIFVLGLTQNFADFGVNDSRVVGGLILSFLSLVGFIFSVSPSQWREQPAPIAQNPNQALQNALALAITEFLREREIRREREEATTMSDQRAA